MDFKLYTYYEWKIDGRGRGEASWTPEDFDNIWSKRGWKPTTIIQLENTPKRFHLRQDKIKEWLENNCNGNVYIWNYLIYCFEDDNDLMAFKLRWS